jgi:hypothetical protein
VKDDKMKNGVFVAVLVSFTVGYGLAETRNFFANNARLDAAVQQFADAKERSDHAANLTCEAWHKGGILVDTAEVNESFTKLCGKRNK